jgi:isorenieratene synthase
MTAEYLVFNLVVISMPLLLAVWPPTDFRSQYLPAFIACFVVAIPYVVWDALVAGAHWDFNPAYVIGARLFGLPVEEILFFFTVPFSCVYTWIILIKGREAKSVPGLRLAYPLLFATLPVGGWALSLGKGYTGLMLISLGAAAALDLLLRTHLLLKPRFWALLAVVAGFTFVFNGYLTARPVVTYGEQYQLGLRVLTIPIEDFGYGTSLVYAVIVVFERIVGKDSPFLGPLMERRFGGYRQLVNEVDEQKPVLAEGSPKVAVVGSGLAGLTAATYLADRGFAVTLFEKDSYLGGKCGSWPIELKNGDRVNAEHGFHAFFRHYYNAFAFLDRVGATANMRQISDYLILAKGGQRYSFKHVATAPAVNLVSLAWNGVYKLAPVVFSKVGPNMECFLRYERDATFAAFDDVSFEQWNEKAKIPPSLMLVFTTFARAFFADRSKISMAELIKSFHFYYLSNDRGLLYDYLTDDYQAALLDPTRERIEERGGEVRLEAPIESIERGEDGLSIAGETFDHVVVATNVPGAKQIIEGSESLAQSAPALAQQVQSLRVGQRYAVLRLWLDRSFCDDWPVFVTTERERVLDSISFIHRAEAASGRWANERKGGVIELHCYAVPDEVETTDIRGLFLDEVEKYVPQFAEAKLLGEDLQVNANMSAFHVGGWKDRPGYETPVEGLYLAGDWVKLPYPAMLMEAACMSGVLCANAILREHGLREEPIYSVPQRGMFAPGSSAA